MKKGCFDVCFLGRMEYAECWELQRRLFDELSDAKRSGTPGRQVLLLVEHPHVYTLGKSGKDSNLLVDENFLRSIGSAYFHTDRGGDITYHGLGQLVGYPILDLENAGMGLREYIEKLEESLIDTVGHYGIEAGTIPGATGVWIKGAEGPSMKIAAIGVKASRHVTMHGFALNVTTDLSYFSWINPCGFTDTGVTSIEKQKGVRPSLEEVGEIFASDFSRRTGMAINRTMYVVEE